MYLKVHDTQQGKVIALCDAELIGTIVSDGKRHLDLQKYSSFYVGKKVGKKEAVKELSGSGNANLVGKKSLDAAKAAGLDVSGTISINGIPHLQIYSIL